LLSIKLTWFFVGFPFKKCDVEKAVAQIQETLAWRKEFGVDVIVNCFAVVNTDRDTKDHQVMRDILTTENLRGKIYTRGYDHEGRALFYMTPARENTNNELNNMRHLVWNLEKAVACTARQSVEIGASTKPLEKINLVIDYDAFKISNAPPMSTTKYTLDILQKRYPERMKHAYLLHPPMVFRVFWSLIKSFVDPVTKEKIVFCSGIEGRSKLTNNVTTKHKLEVRSYGSNPDIRPFDSREFSSLPFNVSFDE
jgi:CRAL/TRIO domain